MPYFECQVVNLAKDGYVLIGLGGPDMGECNTHIPDERFDHYGVSSSGEACVGLQGLAALDADACAGMCEGCWLKRVCLALGRATVWAS